MTAEARAYTEIADALPEFDIDTGNDPLLDGLRASLRQYESLDDGDAKEKLLLELSETIHIDANAFAHILLSQGFRAFRRQQGFLLILAYAFFLIDKIDDCLFLCQALAGAGARGGFLAAVTARCLIEKGRMAEALQTIETSLERNDVIPELIARAALLHAIAGNFAKADEYTAMVKSMYRGVDDGGGEDGEDADEERLERMIFMSEEERLLADTKHADVYFTEEKQAGAWRQYEREIDFSKSRLENDSLFMNDLLISNFEHLLTHDPDISTVINYGSMYGLGEHIFAQAHPQLSVIGYDRSPVAGRLNREAFRADNLAYLDGAFDDAARPHIRGGHSVLGHCRTCTLMYPDSLRALYAQCRGLGITYIVTVEPFTYLETKGIFPDFTRLGQSTARLGGYLLAHDYGHYLRENGYAALRRELHPMTCHFDPGKFPKPYALAMDVTVARLEA